MAKSNVPAVAGASNGVHQVATQEDLSAYSFIDSGAMELIQENLGAEGLSASDFERMKFPSGGGLAWQITDLSGKKKSVDTIDGIILMYKTQHVYWKDEYTGAGTPPDCQSRDLITGYGDPGGSCATCPLSQWESGKNGGKACKKVGVLVMMKPGEMLPVLIPVPVKSVDVVKKFLLKLTTQGIKYFHSIVSIGLQQDKNKKGIEYSKIDPQFVAVLPDEAKVQIDAYKKMLFGALSSVSVNQEDLSEETSQQEAA